MKRNGFFLLIISLSFLLVSKAQSTTEVIQFANEQYKAGNYDIAVKEYNRALFFGHTPSDYPAIQIANCYMQLGNYELASDFFDKAYAYSSSDSLRNESILGKAFCHIMKSQYVLALTELVYFNETNHTNQQAEYHFLNGVSLYGMQKDTLALNELKQSLLVSSNDSTAIAALDEVFSDVFRFNRRFSPKRSYYMSAFIPGSGQIVVGEIKEGLNSLALFGILFYISARIAVNFSYLDAALTILPWM
jgi:tetratricopeptide (TPR) repeat protein